MGALEVGSVVLVPFPFSDLSASKLRPALVIAFVGQDDWICLQITSNPYSDPTAIELAEGDFTSGSLQRISYIRPGKLFTAHQTLFQRVAGRIREQKLEKVRNSVIELIRSGRAQGK